MVKIICYKLFISPYTYSLSSSLLLVIIVSIDDFKIADYLTMKNDSQLFYNLLNVYV